MSTKKDQCITELNKTPTPAYHWKRKDGDNEIKKSKGIHCLQTSDDVLKILKTIIQQRKEKRQQCLLFDRRWKLIKNEVL